MICSVSVGYNLDIFVTSGKRECENVRMNQYV